MPESKTSAIAVVVVTLRVELTQPWGGEWTLEKVQQQAKRDALDRVRCLQFPNSRAQVGQGDREITVGEIHSCRIVLNEEKL